MFPCILPYVVCCNAIVFFFLWVWGTNGVCLALHICVVIGVLVHSAHVEIRGPLWVSVHRCLLRHLSLTWNIMETQQFCWIPPVSISIPSWDYIESRCSQLFIWYSSVYPQVVYRLTIPQPLVCSLVPFGCLLPLSFPSYIRWLTQQQTLVTRWMKLLFINSIHFVIWVRQNSQKRQQK